ncbi:MAG: Uma2 family endonuclease [Treponema sp.]|jgi:Uma2 family endonuclease|nr:Uma2 family endonuclease [Treponema sp.]
MLALQVLEKAVPVTKVANIEPKYLEEVIDGIVYAMGAPTMRHQRIAGNMYGFLMFQLMGHRCQPFIAPCDVLLFPQSAHPEDYVLEPDVFVVCDSAKVQERCYGAPDFILEVLSSSNPKHDLDTKFNLYQRAGVREYWIVDPEKQVFWRFRLNPQGVFEGGCMDARGSAAIEVLPGCAINFDQVFSLWNMR